MTDVTEAVRHMRHCRSTDEEQHLQREPYFATHQDPELLFFFCNCCEYFLLSDATEATICLAFSFAKCSIRTPECIISANIQYLDGRAVYMYIGAISSCSQPYMVLLSTCTHSQQTHV